MAVSGWIYIYHAFKIFNDNVTEFVIFKRKLLSDIFAAAIGLSHFGSSSRKAQVQRQTETQIAKIK
jgi:hypothetical protein